MRKQYQKIHKGSAVTQLQMLVADTYERFGGASKRGALSRTAEHLDMKPKDVHTHLKRYQRNVAIDAGQTVAPWRDSQHGSISATGLGRPPKLRLATLDGKHVEPERSFDPDLPDDDPLEPIEPRDIFSSGAETVKRRYIDFPKRGVGRIIFTGCQDKLRVHDRFWPNLLAYLKWCEDNADGGFAELIVSGLPYNRRMFSAAEKADGVFLDATQLHAIDDRSLRRTIFFDNSIMSYYDERRVHVGNVVDIAAELNPPATAVVPISGFEDYADQRWCIVPHQKQQLQSLPVMPGKPYRAVLSTGVCTPPAYIAVKAGQKAEKHHKLGFAIVEVLPDGRSWVRQVEADPITGDFYDWDRFVSNGVVTEGHNVEAIIFGDVHVEKLDPQVAKVTWGYDVEKQKINKSWERRSLVAQLNPSYQVLHDVCDFSARNHHNIDDPHFLALMRATGRDSVEKDLRDTSKFIESTQRKGCTTVVIQSNHNNAFSRWVKNADVRKDPVNALLWHTKNAEYHRHILEHHCEPDIFQSTIREYARGRLKGVKFVGENDSFSLLGNELSQHGHIGPGGSRGTSVAMVKLALKMTTAHTHSPFYRNGVMVPGVCQLDMGYNRGATTWAVCHVIMHKNGMRQQVFMVGDRYAA